MSVASKPPMSSTDDPLPDLIRALRNRVPVERMRAARDLGRLGWLARDAMPALVKTLDDTEGSVREAAAHSIGLMGPDALSALAGMLRHQDKYVRRHAVWALARLGPLAKPVLPDLCQALKDSDPRTASGAAQALGNLGAEGIDAVSSLAEAMRGTNIVLCRLAAKALSQIGPPALATLIAHLQHADPFVRGESALALGWMGPAARSAVPFLAKLLRAALPNTRLKAMPTGSASDAATPPIPPPSDTSTAEESSCVFAAQALGRIGAAATPALSELRSALQSGSELLRQAARQAIRLIEGM